MFQFKERLWQLGIISNTFNCFKTVGIELKILKTTKIAEIEFAVDIFFRHLNFAHGLVYHYLSIH